MTTNKLSYNKNKEKRNYIQFADKYNITDPKLDQNLRDSLNNKQMLSLFAEAGIELEGGVNFTRTLLEAAASQRHLGYPYHQIKKQVPQLIRRTRRLRADLRAFLIPGLERLKETVLLFDKVTEPINPDIHGVNTLTVRLRYPRLIHRLHRFVQVLKLLENTLQNLPKESIEHKLSLKQYGDSREIAKFITTAYMILEQERPDFRRKTRLIASILRELTSPTRIDLDTAYVKNILKRERKREVLAYKNLRTEYPGLLPLTTKSTMAALQKKWRELKPSK